LLDQPVRPAPLQLALSNHVTVVAYQGGASPLRKPEAKCHAQDDPRCFHADGRGPASRHRLPQADIEACTPDAMRLCQHAFPSESRVVLCLVKNKRQLNAACTMAFNRARSVVAASQRPAMAEQAR